MIWQLVFYIHVIIKFSSGLHIFCDGVQRATHGSADIDEEEGADTATRRKRSGSRVKARADDAEFMSVRVFTR